MSRRYLIPFVLFATLAGISSRARSQEMAPIPEAPEPGDLHEVDDVVDDAEVLPRGDEAPQTDAGKANVEAIEAMHAEELSFSNVEMRAPKLYGVSAGVGASRPWQMYTIDVFAIITPNVTFGMYAGTGQQKQPGAALSQTYSLKVNARTFGFSGRYFFDRFDGLSVEGLLGYAAWDGRLTPNTGDEDLPSDTDKLSAGYHAAGLSGGFGLTVDWIMESGIFFDWMVVGARIGRVQSLDVSRDAPVAERAIKRDLERAAFYGITNVRVGYSF